MIAERWKRRLPAVILECQHGFMFLRKIQHPPTTTTRTTLSLVTDTQRVVHRLGGCVDKGSEWILSVARHRDPLADPVGMLRHAEIDLD